MKNKSEVISGRRKFLGLLGLAGFGSASAAALKPSRADSPSAVPDLTNPSIIDTRLDSRAISAENPTGARGSGGKANGGRKGSACRDIAPGEKVVLADIQGPGTVRHIWVTLPANKPEVMRAQKLEVFYNGGSEPSVSVPLLDFFGLPHGRRAEFYSALISANEGRGFNSYIPMPFFSSLKMEYTNHSDKKVTLFYQVDYTLEPKLPDNVGYLHVAFRRENPTTPRRDFTIAEGLKGPGRFLGCAVGIRCVDPVFWFGEGEVKMYRDGDQEFPTICGTGTEDYVGSAYGLGRHSALYSGCPINVLAPPTPKEPQRTPALVSFYRWHVLDPIIFQKDLRVTIQQMGFTIFTEDQGEAMKAFKAAHPANNLYPMPDGSTSGMPDRRDDVCATSFIYCMEPQPVPRLDVALATKDVARLPFEPEEPVLPGEVVIGHGFVES